VIAATAFVASAVLAPVVNRAKLHGAVGTAALRFLDANPPAEAPR